MKSWRKILSDINFVLAMGALGYAALFMINFLLDQATLTENIIASAIYGVFVSFITVIAMVFKPHLRA